MRGRSSPGIAIAAVVALGGACGPDAEPAPHPPGTALAVDGRPIAAAEVEAAAERVALVYPTRSREHNLSAALESFVLPRAALRSAYATERDAARAACEAAWERIRAGEEPEVAAHRGTADDLTLFLWAAARELEPGSWSGPRERIGSFSIVQLVSREGFTQRESEEVLTLRALEFSYLPDDFAPADLDAALRAARLEVVDPAWGDLVPEHLRYTMRGRSTP